MKSTLPGGLETVKLCCRVLDDKKAGNVIVLDVAAQSSITNYLVIATATSEPHLRALRVELEKALDGAHVPILGMESVQESGWLVIDTFDIMIHLFLTETRERYGLERLWRDAREIPSAKFLRTPAKKSKSPSGKSKVVRKSRAKK
jgi:ribosome-associated protein